MSGRWVYLIGKTCCFFDTYFNISMNNVIRVQVRDCADDRSNKFCCVFFVEASLFANLVKQFSARAYFFVIACFEFSSLCIFEFSSLYIFEFSQFINF